MNRLNPWYTPPAVPRLSRRGYWLFTAFLCVTLLLIGHQYFQRFLYLDPCEYCVYVRLAFLALALVSLFGAWRPGVRWMRNLSTAAAAWVAGYGVKVSWALCTVVWVKRFPEVKDWFSTTACTLTPHFPWGLELHHVSRSWFQPRALCGFEVPHVPPYEHLTGVRAFLVGLVEQDGGWYLFPGLKWITMGDISLLIFTILFVGFTYALYKEARRFLKRAEVY